MYKLVLSLLLVLAPIAAGLASNNDAFSPEKGLDLSRSFHAQRGSIIQALGDGVIYKEISSGDAQAVRESLDRIAGLLGDSQHLDDLSEDAKVRVFNEQEKINVLLLQAHQDSRVICRRETQVGSHRSVNKCATVAERERAREESQEMLRRRPYLQLEGN